VTTTDAAAALDRALAVFDVVQVDEKTFTATSLDHPGGRIFGGQVLAQALIAVGRTVAPERRPHSLHAYFLRAGTTDEPVTYSVETLRDGASFSARRAHASQGGTPILSMTASFQRDDPGLEHADEMPTAPDPETLPSFADLYGEIEHPTAQYWSYGQPIDGRSVSPSIFGQPQAEHSPEVLSWWRVARPLPDDPLLHAAIAAYASDISILEPVARNHGVSWSTPGTSIASLDHAMWFHRPLRADDWILYQAHSPAASGARGLSIGKMFSHDGRLVASVAQEGMFRVPWIGGTDDAR